MSRVAITERDITRMLGIVRDYGEDDGEALPWELLHELKALVPCDYLSASGQDTPTWEMFADQVLPSLDFTAEENEAFEASYRLHYWESDCSYPDRTGDLTSVLRTSDHMSDREMHNSGMYVDVFGPISWEREIMVVLDAGRPQRTLRLIFNRGPGPDFSDRDVAVLTLLRPHLQAAFVAAERRRRGMLPLTRRQRQILQFVAAGYSNRQIARRLDLSEATVRTHLENIFARLQVTSRTAAVARLERPTA